MKFIRKIRPLIDRFSEKYHPEPNTGCWIWLASLDGHGYGHIQGGGTPRMRAAHRVSYELLKGPIPKGLYVDHQCNNKLCVNPDHLKAMTNRDNLLRGNTIIAAQVKRTHCPQGHIYAGNNLRVNNGKRQCKKCDNEKHKIKRQERNIIYMIDVAKMVLDAQPIDYIKGKYDIS